MKGIKIAVTVLTCLTLISIEAGFAQVGKKDKNSVSKQPAQLETKLVTIIRNCSVSYIDTEKLYAMVVTSISSPEKKAEETGKNLGIGKGKSTATATEQKQTVQQTYEFTISPEVEIREQGESGLQFTIETCAAVGFITKADIFVMKNEVVKIIIIDMRQ